MLSCGIPGDGTEADRTLASLCVLQGSSCPIVDRAATVESMLGSVLGPAVCACVWELMCVAETWSVQIADRSARLSLPGACVIDRDGQLFKYILDYLHGEVQLPSDAQTRAALQEEADYFGIPYPYSLSDHLANEMETYSLRSNIELKKVLAFSQVLKYMFIMHKEVYYSA